jgi:hypothetical protein
VRPKQERYVSTSNTLITKFGIRVMTIQRDGEVVYEDPHMPGKPMKLYDSADGFIVCVQVQRGLPLRTGGTRRCAATLACGRRSG